MTQDEDMHNQLMHAFREYFKANQEWLNKGTRTAGMRVRHWLNEIRKLSQQRRRHVMEWRYDLDADKFAKRKSKRQAGGSDDNN